MPKNTGMGGNKRKKGKKQTTEARELVYKGEMEEYGQVLRMLGDARLEIQCIDGVKRIGHIRGKMRKRNWIAMGDVVLVSLREYENEKCDVVEKYNEDEVRKLKKAGEIASTFQIRRISRRTTITMITLSLRTTRTRMTGRKRGTTSPAMTAIAMRRTRRTSMLIKYNSPLIIIILINIKYFQL